MIVTPAGPILERQSIRGSDGLLKVPFLKKIFFSQYKLNSSKITSD